MPLDRLHLVSMLGECVRALLCGDVPDLDGGVGRGGGEGRAVDPVPAQTQHRVRVTPLLHPGILLPLGLDLVFSSTKHGARLQGIHDVEVPNLNAWVEGPYRCNTITQHPTNKLCTYPYSCQWIAADLEKGREGSQATRDREGSREE